MSSKLIGAAVAAFAVLASLAVVLTEREKVAGDVPAPGDVTEAVTPSVPAFTSLPAANVPGETNGWEGMRRPFETVFPGGRESIAGDAAQITVTPHRDLPLTFQRVAGRIDGTHTTWVGRNPAMPGASYVAVSSDRGYNAVLLIPGVSQFNFHVQGDEVLVEEVVSRGSDCALWHEERPRVESSPGTYYWEAGTASADSPSVAGVNAATAALNVDVLFLYNGPALNVARDRAPSDPVGYLEGYTRAALETVNLVLENSRVDTFRWRFVGLVAAPAYPEKETVPQDLDMMAPGEPLHSFVQSQRAQYGADQVMMWVGPGVRQGAAYIGDDRKSPAPANATLAALRLTGGVLILGHELAHNFGCTHDRAHAGSGDGSTAAPEGDGRWNYGLLWTDPGATTTSGTVMAYSDFLVPYFSNPSITLNVTSTMQNRSGPPRDLGTHTIGFTESDPRAANNVRVLNEGAAYMAAVSPEMAAPVAPTPTPTPTPAPPPTSTPNPVTGSAAGGGGGGGAPSIWFIAFLAGAIAARHWRAGTG